MKIFDDHQNKYIIVLVVVGFFLIILGQITTLNISNLDVSLLLGNLGLYISVVVTLQYFFDSKSKRNLIDEVRFASISNSNISKSGISDVLINSKDVNYCDVLGHKSNIVIGFHYSTRIIDDYYDELLSRALKGYSTVLIISDPAGQIGRNLEDIDGEGGHVKPSIEKIVRRVGEINATNNVCSQISICKNGSLLRYSFVKNDVGAWIKPYKNARGRSHIPAFYVRASSSLYEFFDADIDQLVRELS